MCRRSDADPLVELFREQYGVNLLPVPREGARCGELYVQRSKKLAAVPGELRELLEPAVELPPATTGERLASVSGTTSGAVSVRAGLGFLEGFLMVLGAAAAVGPVKAEYTQSRVSRVRFHFEDATRDSIDPLSLGTALIGRRFREAHPWVGPKNRYYVAAGVVRVQSVSIVAEDERERSVDVGVEALDVISATAGISARGSATGEVTYAGAKPLGIGVELYDVRFDEDAGKLVMGSEDTAVALRRGRPAALEPAFPTEEDEALLELEPSP